MIHLKARLRTAYNYAHSRWGDSIYNIGIIPFPHDLPNTAKLPPVKWLRHSYTDRWFADPFIVDADDTTFTIFVETYFYGVRKGAIGRIKASREDFRLLEYNTILELPTHLSFPAWFKRNGEIYVYPENSRSGRLNLYRYDAAADRLIAVDILADEPLTDAVIIPLADKRFITATTSTDPNGDVCIILAGGGDGEPFAPLTTLRMTDNTARGAGLPFEHNGTLYRPAQVCNGAYGIGVALQAVTEAPDGAPALDERCRYMVYDKRYNAGFHTFNRFGDTVVVDGYYYPTGPGTTLFKYLQKLFFKA